MPVSRSSRLKNILCYLIFHRERPVSHDELIETFYENENQRDAVLEKNGMLWSGTITSRYHSLYVEAAETYAELLIEEGETAQAETVCLHAIEREPAGETLYMLLIRALLLQRRYGETRTHYKRISNTLHHSLGVGPSPELRRLYDGIADGKPGQERVLDIVMDGMCETASVRTALFCGFDQFLIMLPEANMEDSRQVMERLVRVYSQRYPAETISLSWQIRGSELL